PLADRVACLRLIPTLYRALFVPRCTERLGHLSEQDGRLDMICYMFWDVACFGGPPGDREGNLFEDSVLEVLEDVLELPHAACQESAVHGLGHRIARHPERAPAVLTRWLEAGPVRDPRLRPYADAARRPRRRPPAAAPASRPRRAPGRAAPPPPPPRAAESRAPPYSLRMIFF